MTELKFTITGQTPAKKSTFRVRMRKGRPYIKPSEEYQVWEKDAAWRLWFQAVNMNFKMPITELIAVEFLIYRKGKARTDLSNLIQSCEDALEKSGIIADDFQIESHDGSRKFLGVKAGEERVEITIRSYDDQKNSD